MRRRILLISVLLLIPACGLVYSWSPVLLIGLGQNISRTRAFGWKSSAACYHASSRNEASIDWAIWGLPLFPSIKEVALSRISPLNEVTPLSDRLARLALNPWVVSLDLTYVDIRDTDLASLAGMSQLEWLDLSANPMITDKGIAHLAKCKRLRHLNLEGTGVTPAGIAALADCQALTHLSMKDCVVTDENVKLIPRFPKMRYLVFNGAALTEDGLEHFVDWHHLSSFAISTTLPKEAQFAFNRRFKAAWERAKAAGEDVPTEKHRGRPLVVPGLGWSDQPAE